MSSLQAALKQAQQGLAHGLGEDVIVYDRHTVVTTGTTNLRVTNLEVAANASGGATTVRLRDIDGRKLRGRIPSGLTIQIGAQTLTVLQPVVANTAVDRFDVVVAALAAPVAQDDLAVLADATELKYKGRRRSTGQQLVLGIGAVGARVKMTLTGEKKPPIGAILEDEVIFDVSETAPLGSGNWRVKAGLVGGGAQ